jgi:peptidyl-prolyl cis-trans isomerase C
MTKTISRLLPQILALSAALLLTGLTACKKAADDPAAAESSAADAGAAPGGIGTLPSHSTSTPGATPADAKPVSPESLPAVIAKVNGEEIDKTEFLQGLQEAQQQLAQMGQAPQTSSAGFYRQVLDHMISQILIQQQAKSEGVKATDVEIQKQMDAFKSRMPTPEAFQQALASQGLTEAKLREQIGLQIAFQKYLATKIVSEQPVTDAAAKAFYDENQAQMQQPERAHLRHILIKTEATTPPADQQKAKEKAEGLLKQIKGGGDFAKLAQANSEDPGSKERGGDLSWVARGQGVPPSFEQAAFALQNPNDVSGVVQSEFGFHIIQLLEKQAPSAVPFEQVKPRISQFLKQRQAQQQVEARVKTLRAKAKVETFI